MARASLMYESNSPYINIIPWLAGVHKVVMQCDPHAPRNRAHGQALHLLLYLELLVVMATLAT